MHIAKGHTVALKRILMHNEKEGMPINALREIKILKALCHPNIIDILCTGYASLIVRPTVTESASHE